MDESAHILKLDASHEFSGVLLEEMFRGEFYNLSTRQNAFISSGSPTLMPISQVDESYKHFVGANALSLEKQVFDWLLLSGGYLYRKLDGDGALSQAIGSVNTLPLELQGLTTTVTKPDIYALGTLTSAVSFLVISLALIAILLLQARQRRHGSDAGKGMV